MPAAQQVLLHLAKKDQDLKLEYVDLEAGWVSYRISLYNAHYINTSVGNFPKDWHVIAAKNFGWTEDMSRRFIWCCIVTLAQSARIL